MDLITGALAYAIEGLLFVWHLHGRDSLDVQVNVRYSYSKFLKDFLLYIILILSIKSDLWYYQICFETWLPFVFALIFFLFADPLCFYIVFIYSYIYSGPHIPGVCCGHVHLGNDLWGVLSWWYQTILVKNCFYSITRLDEY